MIKVSVSFVAYFNPEDLPPVYLSEDQLAGEIKESIEYSLDRLDVREITFKKVDVEGLLLD